LKLVLPNPAAEYSLYIFLNQILEPPDSGGGGNLTISGAHIPVEDYKELFGNGELSQHSLMDQSGLSSFHAEFSLVIRIFQQDADWLPVVKLSSPLAGLNYAVSNCRFPIICSLRSSDLRPNIDNYRF
jgi:hypothetical protein